MSYSTLYLGLGSVDIFNYYTAPSHKCRVADIFDGFKKLINGYLLTFIFIDL